MNIDQVRISVIIPCYNGEQYLPQLLQSLQEQTEPADEIIAVESFSKDRSLEILRAYSRSLPLRIEQRPRAGLYPAWNEGVGFASHSLCYIACVDDLVYPDIFYHLRRLYMAVPNVDLFTWRVKVIDSQANIVAQDGSPIVGSLWGDWVKKTHLRPGIADSLTALTLGSPYLSMMGVAFTRSLWEATGGFPTEYGAAGDVAWQIKAGLRTSIAHLPKTLAAWRVHDLAATTVNRSKEFFIRRKLFRDLSPIVLDHLGISNQRRAHICLELDKVSEQTRMLVLLNRLFKAPSLASISSLGAYHAPGALIALVGQLIWRKLKSRAESSLAIPANRLKRVLQELQLSEPQPLEY